MNNRPTLIAALVLAVAAGAQAEDAKVVDSTPRLASGLLMKQGDKLVFAPCRDRSYAIVDDISSGSTVTLALNSIGLQAGKKLYVELFAAMEGVNLKASGLNFARLDGRCQLPGGAEESWRAAGSTPGWNLVAGGESIRVKRPGKADLSFPFQTFATVGALTSHEASQGGHKLALRFEKSLCRDQGAEVLLGWTATVTVDGETLKGCAWQR